MEVTPEMYVPLIKRLIAENVYYVVAPYEADAQLGYLYRSSLIDFVIAEDGDMLFYGCRRLFTKMKGGKGILIEYDKMFQDDFRGLSDEMLLYVSILAGCDYVNNIRGIGIKKATSIVKKEKTVDNILRYLEQNKNYIETCLFINIFTCRYRTDFQKALNTFRYQIVFDPITHHQRPLLDPPESFELSDHCYLGSVEEDPEHCLQLARGELHPTTEERIDIEIPEDYDPFAFINGRKSNPRCHMNGYFN